MPDRHTFRIRDTGGDAANHYKIIIDGDTPQPEFVDTGGATIDPNDNIYRNGAGNWAVAGRVKHGEDAFVYNGERIRHVVEFPGRMKFAVNSVDFLPCANWDINTRTDWDGDGASADKPPAERPTERPAEQPGDVDVSVPRVDEPIETVTESGSFRFTKRAHAVKDLGMDPNGNEDISARLKAAADDHTLIQFPEGKFRFANQTILENHDDLALRGPENGRALLTVPSNFTERLIIRGGDGLLVKNIDIGLGAKGAVPGVWFSAHERLLVENIEFHGRGIHPNSTFAKHSGNPDETNAVSVGLTKERGRGVVRNLKIINGGQMRNKHHGNSRIGVWGLNEHKGVLDFYNCEVRECPNNGYYTSSCPGLIRVHNSILKDNAVSQIRLANNGSIIEYCDLGYDADESNARDPMMDNHGTQGVAFDSGKTKTGGAVARHCRIDMVKCARGRGGIAVWDRSGEHKIFNVEINIGDNAKSYGQHVMPAIAIERPNGNHRKTDITVRRATLNGTASNGVAFDAAGRRLRLDDICVTQPRRSFAFDDCHTQKRALRANSDSCPSRNAGTDAWRNNPRPSGSKNDGGNGGNDGHSGNGNSGKSGNGNDTLPRTFAVRSKPGGGKKQYIMRVEQDGDMEMTSKNEPGDYAEGPACFGVVKGTDEDAFRFRGEITGFETIGGPVEVELDGKVIDKPWKIGSAIT